MLVGGYVLAFPSMGEKVAADFRSSVESGGDAAQAFARADARLQRLVESERRGRWVRGILGGALAASASAIMIGYELSPTTPKERMNSRLWGGVGVVTGGVLLGSAFLIESSTERLTKIWRNDPSLIQFQPTVSASTNGAMFGLVGTF
jgi:hypothetical protein